MNLDPDDHQETDDDDVYTRDHANEMRKVIDSYTRTGEPYVAGVVANRIAAWLWEHDPDLLSGWLELNAVAFIRQTIASRDAAGRTRARHAARGRTFAAAANAHQHGDPEPLTDFLNVIAVTANGARKRLSELTAADLHLVAVDYEARARDNRMYATFLRTLEAKVGDKTVGQVYTEDQLVRLWNSISQLS